MTKLVQAIVLTIAGLVVLTAAGPAITRLIHALVPLVLVAGVIAAVLRLVTYLTRR